jgi:hypothetical protein
VRLVHREQGDLQPVEARQERIAHQRLGRDVQEVELAGMQPRQRAAGVAGLQRGIVEGCGDAVGEQRVHLVLHQRDERRNDHRRALAMQCGHLVAERLPPAGRHEHEGIPAGDQPVDDFALLGPEGSEAEDPGQGLQRGGRSGWRGNRVRHHGRRSRER